MLGSLIVIAKEIVTSPIQEIIHVGAMESVEGLGLGEGGRLRRRRS